MEMSEFAQRMMDLFRGMEEHHGRWTLGEKDEETGKHGGKAITVKNDPVTVELWRAHLEGRIGLGIIPINRNNMCRWGAIDIDDYRLDHAALLAKIKAADLPLNLFRSKSGGAHLYLFLDAYIKAEKMQRVLREWAARLNLGDSFDCIFPKQKMVDVAKGDVGNWINMPYFAGERWLEVLENGEAISVRPDCFFGTVRVLDAEQLADTKLDLQSSPLTDGPPCLQALSLAGFPEGSRNAGLFNLAVYARKADPQHWKDRVGEYNTAFMRPPLQHTEVETIIKSVDNSTYSYQCHANPIVSFCQSRICHTRKFGVGGTDVSLQATNVTKYEAGSDSVWFVELEGHGRVKLTARQFANFKLFQEQCMAQANFCPVTPSKQAAWDALKSELLRKQTVVQFEEEGSESPEEHFKELVLRFVSLQLGTDSGVLLKSRPYYDKAAERIYFRLKALEEFLERKRFRWNPGQIQAGLADLLQAGKRTLSVRGVQVKCWYVPRTEHMLQEPVAEAAEVEPSGEF